MVLVEPHGVVQPLPEIGLTPARLLVEPTQVGDGRLGQAFRPRRVFGGVAQAQNPVGEVAVVSEATVGSHEGLVVPGLHELVQQGVAVHP